METLQAQKKKGVPTPALDRRPDLPWYLTYWLEDFNVLSNSRTAGMSGYNPIDLPSILQYAQAIGVKRLGLRRFIRIIQYLDNRFLLFWQKKQKAEQERSRKKTPQTPRLRRPGR